MDGTVHDFTVDAMCEGKDYCTHYFYDLDRLFDCVGTPHLVIQKDNNPVIAISNGFRMAYSGLKTFLWDLYIEYLQRYYVLDGDGYSLECKSLLAGILETLTNIPGSVLHGNNPYQTTVTTIWNRVVGNRLPAGWDYRFDFLFLSAVPYSLQVVLLSEDNRFGFASNFRTYFDVGDLQQQTMQLNALARKADLVSRKLRSRHNLIHRQVRPHVAETSENMAAVRQVLSACISARDVTTAENLEFDQLAVNAMASEFQRRTDFDAFNVRFRNCRFVGSSTIDHIMTRCNIIRLDNVTCDDSSSNWWLRC